MHALVHVGVSLPERRSSNSHTFPERSDGDSPLARKGVPVHALGDDQGNLRLQIKEESPLRRGIDRARHREYAVREGPGARFGTRDEGVSRITGRARPQTRNLCVGRHVAKGEDNVSVQ